MDSQHMRYLTCSRVVVLLATTAVLAVVVPTLSYSPPPGSPLANREHPRLLITSASLPALKTKLGSGGVWSSDFKAWVSWADGQYPSYSGVSGTELPRWLANYALIWITHPVAGVNYGKSKAEYGAAAKSMLMRLVSVSQKASNYDYYPGNSGLRLDSAALEWSEKAALAAFFKGIDEQQMTDAPKSPFNSQVAAARSQKILGALAIASDGADDAWADAALSRYPEFFSDTTGVTRSESDLGGEDGSMGQGNAYALAYTLPHVIVAEEAWRTANGIGSAAFYAIPERSFLRRMPQYFADQVLPWGVPTQGMAGGRRYVLSKNQRAAANLGAAESPSFALLTGLAGILKNIDPQMAGLAQWLVDNRVGDIPAGDVYNGRFPAIWKFVLGDKATPVHPSEAGMSLSHANQDGKFVFRTGWDDHSDSYITFRANRWMRATGGMSPNAPGSFTIDCNGPQVTFQGGNDGHDWGSYDGAGPGNHLIFPDRTQTKTTGAWDDEGGHRLLPGDSSGSVTFVPGSPHDTRESMRFLAANPSTARDVDYVWVDVTRSYNSTRFKDDYNPARVSEVVREMVYFRPENPGVDSDRVVVLDRATTTDTRFEKRWLFHTSGEPMVNGSVSRCSSAYWERCGQVDLHRCHESDGHQHGERLERSHVLVAPVAHKPSHREGRWP